MAAALMLGAWVELSLTCVKFPEVCQESHDSETDCDRRCPSSWPGWPLSVSLG